MTWIGLRPGIPIGLTLATVFSVPAFAQQVLRLDSPNSCETQGGTLSGNVPGTPTTLGPFSVTNGVNVGGQDFRFDLTETVLEAFKTVELFDTTGFALPSNDVVYTITILNRGDGAVTTDSIFLIDALPDEVIFFNDPLALSVTFTETGSNLTFDPNTDARFALAGPPPANFTACTYTPAAGYDPLARFVCLNPKGAMAAGAPDPMIALSFRTRLR